MSGTTGCQGYLKKKGQKRWFLIHNNVLYWFKNEQKSATFVHSEIKGCLELRGCTARPDPAGGKEYPFIVENAQDRTRYVLVAPSSDLMEKWLSAISASIAELSQQGASEIKRGPLIVQGAEHQVVLKEDSIMWFQTSATDKKAKGSLALAGAKVQRGSRPTSFTITGASSRPLEFIASAENICGSWTEAIGGVLEELDAERNESGEEKSGYLQKKGQTRWFTIQKGKLLWFNKMQKETTGASANNYLVLSQTTLTPLPPAPGRYPIRLVMNAEGKSKVYELTAPSENELRDWIDALVSSGATNTDATTQPQPTIVQDVRKPVSEDKPVPVPVRPVSAMLPRSVANDIDRGNVASSVPAGDGPLGERRKPAPPVPPRNSRTSLPTTGINPQAYTGGAVAPVGETAGAGTKLPSKAVDGPANSSTNNRKSLNPATKARGYSVYANTSNEKSGWLTKKGKKRWFVLSKGGLHWYNQAKQQGGTSNGSLQVSDCEVTCLGELQGSYGFSITQKGGSEYILLASSLTEMEDWVLTLMRAGAKVDSASIPGGAGVAPTSGTQGGLTNSDFSSTRSVYSAVSSTKSGWLEKKGRKRWFVLRKGELSWFKATPLNEEAFKKDVAGHLELKQCRVRKLDEGRKIKGKFGLFLCTIPTAGDDEGSEYLLLHPKDAEIDEWVEYLIKEGAELDGPASILSTLTGPVKPAGGKLFGGDLKEILQREGRLDTGIPELVERCTNYIRSTGLEAEGVFRLSGDSLDVNHLKKQFDQGLPVSDADFQIDVHAISSLLKLFFREMEPPLMTYELYDTFMVAATKDVATVKAVVLSLPPENLKLLKYLMYFLHEVSTYQAINKMAPANLSICFSPNLFRSKGSPLAMLTNSAHTGTLTQMMVAYPNYFWPPETVAQPAVEVTETTVPVYEESSSESGEGTGGNDTEQNWPTTADSGHTDSEDTGGTASPRDESDNDTDRASEEPAESNTTTTTTTTPSTDEDQPPQTASENSADKTAGDRSAHRRGTAVIGSRPQSIYNRQNKDGSGTP